LPFRNRAPSATLTESSGRAMMRFTINSPSSGKTTISPRRYSRWLNVIIMSSGYRVGSMEPEGTRKKRISRQAKKYNPTRRSISSTTSPTFWLCATIKMRRFREIVPGIGCASMFSISVTRATVASAMSVLMLRLNMIPNIAWIASLRQPIPGRNRICWSLSR